MPVATLRQNIIANYVGQGWTVLMGVLFVPVYLRWLGAEAFGLVALLLSLQVLSQIFDLGAGSAVNRELSARSNLSTDAGAVRDLVRTLELAVWLISAMIGLALWLGAPSIAKHWLNIEQLAAEDAIHALSLIALAVASFWPSSFYSNALAGLERHGTLNAINAIFATLRGVGALGALYWIAPTIEVFLWWQTLTGATHSMVLAMTLWRALPSASTIPRIVWPQLVSLAPFASGVFLISLTSVALSQIDRLVLSTMRPLEELGYYGIAISVAAGLGRMTLPMFNSIYPRFTRLAVSGQPKELVDLYRLATQYLAVIVAPVGAVLIVFGADVLLLWSGDLALAELAAPPLALLVGGAALNGFVSISYALQLAHGRTHYAIVANLAALLLAVPFGVWAVSSHGMVGAASIWLAINLGYWLLLVPVAHSRLLPGMPYTYFVKDCLLPAIATGCVAMSIRWMYPSLSRDVNGLGVLIATGLLALLVSIVSVRHPRDALRSTLIGKRI